MPITQFDKRNLNDLHERMAKALEPFAKEFGITIRPSGGTIGSIESTLKFQVKVADPDIQKNAAKKLFDTYCSMYGLRPQDWGTTIRENTKVLTLVGIEVRRVKYPLRMRDQNGKEMLYTEHLVSKIKAATDAKQKEHA